MAADSPRLRTAKSYINYFATLDNSLLSPLLSDDTFEHIMAPSAHLGKIMSGFPVVAKEYLESESGNSVVVWATSKTQFRDAAKRDEEDWDYEGEYVFFLKMDTSGERIVRVVEILDSLKTDRDLRPLMRRARERLGVLHGNTV
ncbi:hypothetical protein N0V93_001391 [Gnomoniopsis smithogilvyi]|uniref:Uncharacterized protein n=1 Tax=Gnomoniopsis smithogilvyi TaxID=1191159 RepID=A0A9W8Z5U1_9PEZI|nr:hypothetical protein N0V93_001391 [Gnomoniopsis smithogilvyi]